MCVDFFNLHFKPFITELNSIIRSGKIGATNRLKMSPLSKYFALCVNNSGAITKYFTFFRFKNNKVLDLTKEAECLIFLNLRRNK